MELNIQYSLLTLGAEIRWDMSKISNIILKYPEQQDGYVDNTSF